MAPQTEGYVPLVCGEKTMCNPMPTQAAMSTKNTHRTSFLRAVRAKTLHPVEIRFENGRGGSG